MPQGEGRAGVTIKNIHRGLGVCVVLSVMLGAVPASAQEPPKNLQYFDADISPRRPDPAHARAFALDVRCQHCHAGGDGISFDGVVFESDEKLAKRKARYMLAMVDEINTSLLSGVPERGRRLRRAG